MTSLTHQLVALQNELQHLETLLADDPYWQALSELDRESAHSPEQKKDHVLRRETLSAALSDNRIYQAHLRLSEAIKVLSVDQVQTVDQQLDAGQALAEDCASQAQFKFDADASSEEHAKAEDDATVDTVDQQSIEKFIVAEPVQQSPALPVELPVAEPPSGEVPVIPDVETSAAVPTPAVLAIHDTPPQAQKASATSSRPDKPDDLTDIRTITRAQAAMLGELGVRYFDDIAEWTTADVKTMRAALGLGSTISSQNWIEQAALFVLKRAPEVSKSTPVEQPSVVPEPVLQPVAVERAISQTPSEPLLDVKTNSPPQVTEDTPHSPAEGLIALRGVTEENVGQFQDVGLGSFEDIAAIDRSGISRLRRRFYTMGGFIHDSWIEQAAMLADGRVTHHLTRQRRGDFSSVVSAPKLKPVVDPHLSQRLLELIGPSAHELAGTQNAEVEAASSINATVDRSSRLEMVALPPSNAAQDLIEADTGHLITPPPNPLFAPTQSSSRPRQELPEKPDPVALEVEQDQSLSEVEVAEPTVVIVPAEVTVHPVITQPDHVVANDTQPAQSDVYEVKPNSVGVQPVSPAISSDSPAVFEDPGRLTELRSYIDDTLKHAGTGEAEVVIRPTNDPDDLDFQKTATHTHEDTTMQIDEGAQATVPRFAPSFLKKAIAESQPKDERAIPDEFSDVDDEFVVRHGESFAEASVEILVDGDNTSHPSALPDVEPKTNFNPPDQGRNEPRKNGRNRFFRALTGN